MTPSRQILGRKPIMKHEGDMANGEMPAKWTQIARRRIE